MPDAVEYLLCLKLCRHNSLKASTISCDSSSALQQFTEPNIFSQVSEKLKTILGLWNGGRGVVSLEIFHYTTAQEAFTREACIIDAIGE